MSKDYLEKFGDKIISRDEMRKYCQRPGRTNKDGSPCYTTEQAHKDICDINKIIARFDRDGVITHVKDFEGNFGNMTGGDFQDAMNMIAKAKNLFNQLPAKIREEFDNNPAKLLSFMEDPSNRDKAIEMGIIDEMTPAHLDGLGEHVTSDMVSSAETDTEVSSAETDTNPTE